MIGDAVPIRFSRRFRRKASLSPVKVPVKKKTRRLAVKKRTSCANSSLLKATEKTKVGKKSKSEKNPNQTSGLNSSLHKGTERAKVGKESKLTKNSKEISKQSSHNLKPTTFKITRKKLSKIFDQKIKTRSSLNVSQVNLTDNDKQQNLEVELPKERKKSLEKKNHTESKGNKNHSVRSSLRVSKSLLLAEDKDKSKELNVSKVKSPRVKQQTQKKSSLEVTSISPKSVLILNTRKSSRTSRHSEGKKSAKLSTASLNQEISLQLPISKSPLVTQPPDKYTRTTRLSKSARSSEIPSQSKIPSSGISLNTSACQSILETPHPEKHSKKRKSTRSSKGPNQSRILSSGISLNTSQFQSILETPHPEKHSEKRKSSRIFEPTPLRTLNKELSLSTPESVLGNNQDSMLSKSSQISKSAELLAAENPVGKRARPKVSNKKITSNSLEKLKPSLGRQVNKQKKASENFKLPLSKVTNNFPFDVLSTPDFTAIAVKSTSDKCLSKPCSKSSKRKLHRSATENHVAREDLQDAKKRKKSAASPNMCAKGTLKHKRWLLNRLKETNGYEDDIFENQKFDQYKTFQFGDESDGSSVNIATPKFDCILTPALPKKTPRFKDCISPTELLQARKTAEEYLYRRNKKRKSGDMPSSSGKNASMNKKNTTEGIPEKKKLDFEETVNKLIEVQKNLENDAEIGDEEEDSYFSDASN